MTLPRRALIEPHSRHSRRGRRSAGVAVLAFAVAATGVLLPRPTASASATEPTTLTAVADAYASRSEPTTVTGDRQVAYAFGEENRAFLKFNTKGVVSKDTDIASLTLRVYVVQTLTSRPQIEVHPQVSSWSEETLTHDNAPAQQGSVLSAFVPAASGNWMDIPLSRTGSLDVDGYSSFEISGLTDDSAFEFATRESSHAPQLVITPGSAGVAANKAESTSELSLSNVPFSPAQSSGKLVFAHYVAPFPISLDDEPPADDYYARNYMQPGGENGKFASSGGLMRDRPAGRDPEGGDYVATDDAQTIKNAQAAGVDGFTMDIMANSGQNWDRVTKMLDVADSMGFRMMAMPDMTCVGELSAQDMATMLALFASHGSAFRLADGRLVVSPFAASVHDPSWWSDVASILQSSYGIGIALVPTFIDWPGNITDWSQISYGMSIWGGRSPANIYSDYGIAAHKLGKIWMQPVAVQDERPAQGVYDEAEGLETLRRSWAVVESTQADWVQVATWNDFPETTAIAPSQNHGSVFATMNSYFASHFKTGAYPNITSNALMMVHRNQPLDANPLYKQSVVMKVRSNSSPPVDKAELDVLLTTSASISITSGGHAETMAVPAGYSHLSVPLGSGNVSASVKLDDGRSFEATSPIVVSSMPSLRDLEYYASGVVMN